MQLLSSPSPSTVWIISTAKVDHDQNWPRWTAYNASSLSGLALLALEHPVLHVQHRAHVLGRQDMVNKFIMSCHHGCHDHDHDHVLHVQHRAHVLGRRPLFKPAFNLFWKPVSDCSCLGGPCCRRGTVLDCNCKQKVLKSSDLFLRLFFTAKEILSFAGSQDM